MALAIDTIDGRGLSNEVRHELLPKKSNVTLYLLFITVVHYQQDAVLQFLKVGMPCRFRSL